MSLTEIINPQPGSIFWTLITFIILLVVLKYTAWGPLISGLNQREERIRKDLDDAKKEHEDAVKLRQQYDDMLKEARSESQKILDKARDHSRAYEEEQKSRIREELGQLREKAKADIDLEARKALDIVREEAVNMVISAARQVTGKTLTPDDNEQFIRQTLSEMDRDDV